MSISKKILFLGFLFCIDHAVAQDTTHTRPFRSFSFSYDNDFFLATDRYYTQGVYMELTAPFVKKSPLSHLLIPISKNAENLYSLSLEHDVFTPYSILHIGIYYDERPYTAALFFSHRLKSYDGRKIWETQFDLGIMGPSAFGEQMQKGIHRALDNALPRAWETQLSDDLILNYNAKGEKIMINEGFLTFHAISDYRMGTMYDDIGLGFNFKIGDDRARNRNFGVSLFGTSELNAVGYNATLQGGMFNRTSIYTLKKEQIERILLKAEGGISLRIKKFFIVYSFNYVTREFHTGLDHSWGHIQFVGVF